MARSSASPEARHPGAYGDTLLAMIRIVSMLQSAHPGEIGAAVAVFAALIQVLAAHRRDLGPATVAALGVALLLGSPGGTPIFGEICAAAGGLAAIAWIRGGRAGVGRLDVVGPVGTVALGAYLAVHGVAAPVLDPDVAAALVTLAGVVGTLLSLGRPWPAGLRSRRIRRVPIEIGPPPSGR